ncbi:hypothetical protein [Massilia sp. TSP1-1-2]|uniref:hypothetical protein n=1 Tax=Massilia sp. TSP1-1-2 TaxID=2804649 RepID=UPI003CFBA1ED
MTAAANSNMPPIGRPGDFDFLSGQWKIAHRQLQAGSVDVWDSFDGEATCWSILDGAASVEELRIPSRNFSGMGLRLLNKENQVWSDFWVNAKSGVLLTPGSEGYFEQGVGVFTSHGMDGEHPVEVRGMWDNISAAACRWQQASSRDAGASWQTNWVMDWVRVA